MKVMLFGSIAEKAESGMVSIDATSVGELRQALIARIPELIGMRYAIAVDRRVVTDDRALTGAEEVAVLPPFAGG
jgi:molybdopterin converting factor small subunit